MSNTVTISNGQQFFRIEQRDLAEALKDGFYRPIERGLTIVSDGSNLFEIPLSDLEAASADGYRDLLKAERLGQTNGIPAKLKRAESANAVSVETLDESELLIDGLTQAEQEAEQERLQRQQHLDETEGWRWYTLYTRMWLQDRHRALVDQLQGSSVSIVVHVAILLLLASLALVNEKEEHGLLLSATPTSDEIVDEVMIEPTPLDITDPTEEESEAAPESEEMPMQMTESVNAPNFLANVSGTAIAAPAKPAAEPAQGKAMSAKASKVFGTSKSARDYVFVIDNSNSMTKGRFETALYELMVAVNALTPKQNFYVIFYSDTAYTMMHPSRVDRLVAATPQNKKLLASWLMTVPLCLKTNGKGAIEIGFKLQPDVMYVLGDGAFTDGASKHFSKLSRTKTTVHTRGMQVDAKNAAEFESLAKAHGGNYKDVGVHAFAAKIAKDKPRPRNNTRNGYWGLKLPLTKAKK